MSILIKGMEMPTSCYYCPFADGTWGYSPPHKKRCLIIGKDMPVDERYVQHNQADCPLIELPPHGGLVDANRLIEIGLHLMHIAKNDDIAIGVKWLWQYILEAPIVIEAEEDQA